MLRFGNPYTRDSSAAARNQRAAAGAIARAGGRSGGVGNLNSNRDMSHRVVTALALACPCPVVVPAPAPAPPVPPVCGPMTPDWVVYAPRATPTWSLTDGSDNAVVSGYIEQDTSGEFFDSSGRLLRSFPLTLRNYQRGFIISCSSSGNINWLLTTFKAGNTQPLKVVGDSLGNFYFMLTSFNASSANVLTIVSDDGTPTNTSPISGINTIYIGKINSSGILQWCAQVSSNNLESSPIQLEAIDLAVSADGGRVMLYGRASVVSLPVSRTAFFYNSTGGTDFSLGATPASSPLFLYSLDAAGLDGRVATIRPDLSTGYVFGVNLLNVGSHMAATAYGLSNDQMLITDSSLASDTVPMQDASTNTGFVVQFNPVAELEWAVRVVGSINPTATPVSTSSAFAGRYQRGIIGVAGGGGYVYTGNYSDISDGISFVDSDGFAPETLARSPNGAIYMAPLSLAGLHTAPWHADTSGGVRLLVLNGYVDASAGDVYFLCSATLQASVDGAAYFYNTGAVVPAVSVLLPFSGGSVYHLLVKYSATGVCQWIRRMGGINDPFYGNVVVSSRGCPIVYGPYMGSVMRIYDGAGIVVGSLANSGGGRDGFFAKWTPDGDFVGVAGLLTTANDANIWMTVAGGGDAYTLTNNWGNLRLQNMSGATVFNVPSGAVTAMTLTRWTAM